MAYDKLPAFRQTDFALGPNYTDLPWNLRDGELAEAENMWWEGRLKSVPNAGRIVNGAALSARPTSFFVFNTKAHDHTLLITTRDGKIQRPNSAGDGFTTLASGLAIGDFWWSWRIFNDVAIGASRANTVRTYTSGGSTGVLAGTPPNFAYLENHVDYFLGAGHLSEPSQIRYSDTADATSWPVGNVLNVGLDDGQTITGLQHYGDVTFVF